MIDILVNIRLNRKGISNKILLMKKKISNKINLRNLNQIRTKTNYKANNHLQRNKSLLKKYKSPQKNLIYKKTNKKIKVKIESHGAN